MDVRLAEYNGLQLAIYSREDQPDLPVIVTNFSEDKIVEADAVRYGATFIADPEHNAAFLFTVQGVLAARQATERRSRHWNRRIVSNVVEVHAANARAQILDVSYGGMKLAFSGAQEIPPTFDITLPSADVTVQVSRVWTDDPTTAGMALRRATGKSHRTTLVAVRRHASLIAADVVDSTSEIDQLSGSCHRLIAAASFTSANAQKLLISGKRPQPMMESVGPQVAARPAVVRRRSCDLGIDRTERRRSHLVRRHGRRHAGSIRPSVRESTRPRIVSFHGDVVGQLSAAGILRKGEHQARSTRESFKGPTTTCIFRRWTKKASTKTARSYHDGAPFVANESRHIQVGASSRDPEALIAVAVGDRYVYALGYFGHVLFQFDTMTRDVKRIPVGSLGGHVSRNFIADYRGHAFVPGCAPTRRLTANGARVDRRARAESGRAERNAARTGALFRGVATEPTESPASRKWRTAPVLQHSRRLPLSRSRLLVPRPSITARRRFLASAGSIRAVRYVASLFSPDGADTVLALSHNILSTAATGRYQWLTLDLKNGVSRVAPFAVREYGRVCGLADAVVRVVDRDSLETITSSASPRTARTAKCRSCCA